MNTCIISIIKRGRIYNLQNWISILIILFIFIYEREHWNLQECLPFKVQYLQCHNYKLARCVCKHSFKYPTHDEVLKAVEPCSFPFIGLKQGREIGFHTNV